MDNLILHAVFLDFRDRFADRRVAAVESPLEHSFLFRFDPPARPALIVSVHPDLAGLFPMRRVPRRRAPTSGSPAARLHRVLAGSRLVAVEKGFAERVIRFRFDGARWEGGRAEATMIAECLGRSANLVLLRPDGAVAATARTLRSRFRHLRPGDPYADPPARPGDPWVAGGPDGVAARLRQAPDRSALAESAFRHLAPSLFDLWRRSDGGDPAGFLETVLTGFRPGTLRPVLYLEGLAVDPDPVEPVTRKTAILAPQPLPFPVRCAHIPFRGIREAANHLIESAHRHRRFASERAAVHRAAARELKKIVKLRLELEGDLERVRDPDPLRIRGEALLAGLASARVIAGRVRVADPYDPDGAPLEFDLPDPGKSLADNAAILFHRHRRARRGRGRIEQRLQQIGPRAAVLADLAGRAGACRTGADLRVLADGLEQLGIVRPAPAGRGPQPRRREFRALRRATSPDGWVVFIGRNAAENDELTFRIASEWDFWFHAAAVSGSHVVARNPVRKNRIPEPTLRMAAAAAAWYSGSRAGGTVEVHYALRKHLRKGKRPGQVLVKRLRSIRVAPADPLAEKT